MTPEEKLKEIREYCEKRILLSESMICGDYGKETKRIEQIIVGEFEKLLSFIDSDPKPDKCKWKHEGHDHYKTDCGHSMSADIFSFEDNETCDYCGREIEIEGE